MQAMIDELAKQAAESLGQVSSKETLASFWQEYLSKNGKIPALMKNLRSVAPEERPAMGKIINELKAKVQADYDAAAATGEGGRAGCPQRCRDRGHHPARQDPRGGRSAPADAGHQPDHRRVLRHGLCGGGRFPEIEDDDHNFTRLNVPEGSPRPRHAGYLLPVR